MKKFLPYIFLLIAGFIFIADQFQKLHYSPDDTYIYMQYARNFASGNRLSFNAGEPSYGVTSPVWAVMLSSGYLAGLEGYHFAKLLDLLFLILSVIMFHQLAKIVLRDGNKQDENTDMLAMLAVSVFLLNTWFIRWSFTGMETSFAVYLVLTVFYCFYTNKYKSLYTILAILFLVRPESIVLTFLITAYYIFSREQFRNYFSGGLIYVILLAGFFYFAKNTFGTIFPNTTIGKATFSIGLDIYIPQIKRILQTVSLSSIIELVLSFVFVFFLFKDRKLSKNIMLVLWPLGLAALYIITDADIISRYLLIIIPLVTIAGISVLSLLNSKAFYAAIAVFLLSATQSEIVFYKIVKPHTDNFSYGVNNCFKEIASLLKENTNPKSKILVNDVGAIGYYSERYIIDAAALVNRDLALNKKIMQTPVKERESTANLLPLVRADYLIQRDKDKASVLDSIGVIRLEFMKVYEFPSLGISDPSPTYYKIYKVNYP